LRSSRLKSASNDGFSQPSPAQQHPPASAPEPAAARHEPGAVGGARAAAAGGRLPQGRPAGAPGRRGDGAVLHPRGHGEARGVQPRGPRDDPALRGRDRDGHVLCRVAAQDAGAVLDRGRDQSARRRVADAGVGRVPRPQPRAQGALRVRGDEADVGGDGAHHHAAPARRARTPVALSEETPRAGRPHPEERARRLPEPHARDAVAPQAEARLARTVMPEPSPRQINWSDQPEEHNYPAAESYLALLFEEKTVADYVKRLRKARMSKFKAKDIFRAS